VPWLGRILVPVLFPFLLALSAHAEDFLVPAGERRAVAAEAGEGRGKRTILENGFLRAVIDPLRGARVVSLVHKKSGQELTRPPTTTRRGGLLSDQVWQQNYWHGDWNRSAYRCEILSRGSEEVKVRMSCTGPQWDHVTIERTVTLRSDRAVLEIDYTITGGKTSWPRRGLPDFWFHHTLSGPGRTFMPSPTGVRVRPTALEAESWVYDPTRNWIAYVSDQGAGMVGIMDFARLRCLRSMHEPDRTVEWIFRRMDLKPGEKLETPVRLGFFSGLKEVSGACERVAVSLVVGEPKDGKAPVTVMLAALADLTADLSLSVRRFPKGTGGPVGEAKIALKADATESHEFSAVLQGEGTFVVRGTLRKGDETLLFFERDLSVGKPSGAYVMPPQSPKVPEQAYGSTKSLMRPFDLDFSNQAVETPHFDWCEKSAVGRPRVLALVADKKERELIELAQRFDIDLTTCLLVRPRPWVLGDGVYTLKKEMMDAHVMEQLGKEWDLIIVHQSGNDKEATHTWGFLPEKIRLRISEMVADGVGLWHTMPFVPMEIDQSTPLEPRLEGDDIWWVTPEEYTFFRKGALGTCGDGNAVIGMPMTTQARLPRSQTALDYWEYQYAALGHLLYWAAGYELPVVTDEIDCSPGKVSVSLTSEEDYDAKVRVRVRNEFGDVLIEKSMEAELEAGESTDVELELSEKEGSAAFVADIIVSSEDGVLTWGAETFVRPKVKIVRWQPDEKAFGREEQAKLMARIMGELPPEAKLRVRATDGFGRLLGEAEVPAAAKTPVALPLSRSMGFAFEARATLQAGEVVIDQALCEGSIRPPARRRLDRFRAYFWGGSGLRERRSHMVFDLYKRYRYVGMNANWGDKYPGSNSWAFDRLNMTFEIASVGMRFQGLTKQEMAEEPDYKGGIGDPAVAEVMREKGVRAAETWKHRNVFVYGCADENPGPGMDVSFSAAALAEFRRWLQETQYKSLAELNEEWQTDFGTWEEVMPLTEAEAKEHGGKTGSYAAWADQRQFNKWSYARYARAFVEGVRSVDPGAIVGASGTQEPAAYSGRDWWLLARAYTGLSAYGGMQTHEQMAYNPSLIRYNWQGYNKDNPRLRNGTWSCLSSQNYGFGVFVDRTHIDPDLTLSMHGRELKATLTEMNRGVAQMLVSARRVWDPVFVLQSSASIHGAHILGKWDLHRGNHGGLRRFLPDLPVTYRPISYQQLAEGKLSEFGARVLILPHTVALSKEECDSIRQWVSAGGILLADLEPGIMTEHCRLAGKGQLDDLLGVDRGDVELTDGKWDLRPIGASNEVPGWPAGVVETGIKAAAKALWTATSEDGESVPIVYYRKVGKGQTFYFACDAFRHYGRVRAKALSAEERPAVASFQSLIGKVLTDADVKPPVSATLLDAPPGPVWPRCPFLNLYAKEDGAIRYYTAIRDVYLSGLTVEDTPARVVFAREGYIYDVLGQKFLGRGNSVALVLTKYTMRLFAVLPYRVDGLSLSASSGQLKQGEDLSLSAQLEVSDGQPGRHWFRVEVARPDGQFDWAYSGDIEAKEGRAEIKVPFALNDPPGRWTIHVQDAATGELARATVDLVTR